MDRNNIIKIINKIFLKFQDIKAKIWNIDTDVLASWKRFADLLIEKKFTFDTFDYDKIFIKKTNHPKKENENYFIILLNDINVTPRKNGKEQGWALSSLRQFLQIGSSFGLIMFSPRDDIYQKDFFSISPKIANILEENFDWSNLLLASISNSYYSSAKHINNFGFSFLFAYVVFHDENILSEMPGIIQFECVKHKKNIRPFHSQDNFAINYAKKIFKETYKKMIDEINNKYDFEYVICKIMLWIDPKEKDNDYIQKFIDDYEFKNNFNKKLITDDEILKEADYIKKEKDFILNIKKERSKIRKEIIDIRANNLDKYTDIDISNIPPIEQTEAAHIFDVSLIKKEGIDFLKNNLHNSENFLKKKIYEISDPNNILLLPTLVHKEFDKDIFQFDIKGKVIFQKENLERIKCLGIENARIKKSILNQNMIQYLKKRISSI